MCTEHFFVFRETDDSIFSQVSVTRISKVKVLERLSNFALWPTELGLLFDTKAMFFAFVKTAYALTIQASGFVVKLDEFGVVFLHFSSSLFTPFSPRPRELLPVTRRSHYACHD